MAGSFYDALVSGEIKGLEALERQANSDAIQAASQAACLPHIAALVNELPHIAALVNEVDAATALSRDIMRTLPHQDAAYLLAVVLIREVRKDAPTVPAPVSAVNYDPDLADRLANGAYDRD